MKKKIIKYKSCFSNQEIRIFICYEKSNTTITKAESAKIALCNEALKGVKLP